MDTRSFYETLTALLSKRGVDVPVSRYGRNEDCVIEMKLYDPVTEEVFVLRLWKEGEKEGIA